MIEWIEYLECYDFENVTYCDFSTWFGVLIGSIIAIVGITVAFFFFSRQMKQSSKQEDLIKEIGKINTKLDNYKKDHNKIASNVFSNYLYDIRNVLNDIVSKLKQKDLLEKEITDEYIIKSSITAIRQVITVSSSYIEPPELSVELTALCNNLDENYLKKNKIELVTMKELLRLSQEFLQKYFKDFSEEKKRLMREIKNIGLEDDATKSK